MAAFPDGNHQFVIIKRLDVEIGHEMRVLKGPSAAGQDDVKAPIPEFLRERKCVHGIHFEHDQWILLYERFAQGSWPQAVEPRSEGVSGDPRRYGVGGRPAMLCRSSCRRPIPRRSGPG